MTTLDSRQAGRFELLRVVGIELQLADTTGTIARLARNLTMTIRELEQLTSTPPTLLAIPGYAALTATKIIGETASADHFTNTDTFARYNDTTPFARLVLQHAPSQAVTTSNRQPNTAIHRIALTQARHHQPAKDHIKRRAENGKSSREILHILKRHLSRTVYQALQTDQQASPALTT